MGTPKRERQRQNRDLSRAAAEAVAKKAAMNRRIKTIGISVAVLLVVGTTLMLYNRFTNDADTADADNAADTDIDDTYADDTTDAPMECPVSGDASRRVLQFNGRQPDCIDPTRGYSAIFDTSEGEMRFDLHVDEVPSTVNNFVTLTRWGYYDDTLVFRTDPSIDIIQGGSPHTQSANDLGPGYTILDEPQFAADPSTGRLAGPYRYQPGQLVMARTEEPNSAGAQFFITTGPNASFLDSQGTYVVFGTTDEAGLAVAKSIIDLHEPGGRLGGAPSKEVTVHSITIQETETIQEPETIGEGE